MARKFEVEVTVPEGLKAGDTFTIEVEAPAPVRKPRGQLAGIALEDMTDEQLKREIINAKSVLYKAKQRGASEEVIAANQARVDRAMAEKAKRANIKAEQEKADAAKKAENTDEALAKAEKSDNVYDEDTAAEV